MLRVTPVPSTILRLSQCWAGKWNPSGAPSSKLTAAGVIFLRYPGLNDASPHGIWTAPGGARIAWFHDPTNVLSLTQF